MRFDSSPDYNSIDEYYIGRCLELAALGRASVSPNPMVGAIVVNAQGQKVGEGYHQKAGEAHAEVIALDQAGEEAKGGTLYLNLEPCNHQGRTPPCTQRIISAGIERVVIGTLDPNPLVAGTGRDALQNARISVRHGFLSEECQRLNEVFFHYITTQTPFVTLKLALTLDGKVATRSGKSQWLTGNFSRQYVHHLRHQNDAVLTTADTVLADNPSLTVRDIPTVCRQPRRVILDRRFKLNPHQGKIFEGDPGRIWVVTSKLEHNRRHAEAAREKGINIIEVNESPDGLDLRETLRKLAAAEITSVMVEAGGRLSGQMIAQGLVNKFYLFYAPKIINDTMARPAFGQALVLDLPQKPQFDIVCTRQLENDLVVEAYPVTKAAPLKLPV